MDETGARAAPEGGGAPGLAWIHAAATDSLTHLEASAHRGAKAWGGAKLAFGGVAVHDGWAPYRKMAAATHALCNAHHLRELAFVHEEMGQSWAGAAAELLRRACHAKGEGGGAALPAELLARMRARWGRLMGEGLAANPEPERPAGSRGRARQGKARSLALRLMERADEVWRFAEDGRVPFTNNLAERTMRMPKVKMKVSGCFRSFAGLVDFCALRSYLDTLQKQGMGLLESLASAFEGEAPRPLMS